MATNTRLQSHALTYTHIHTHVYAYWETKVWNIEKYAKIIAYHPQISLNRLGFCLFFVCLGFNVALKHLRSYHDGACL